jgi:hypothetical protein
MTNKMTFIAPLLASGKGLNMPHAQRPRNGVSTSL